MEKLFVGEEKKVLTEIHHSSQNPTQSQIQKIVQGKDHYLFFECLFLTEFGETQKIGDTGFLFFFLGSW
jgi:hypothetical protein